MLSVKTVMSDQAERSLLTLSGRRRKVSAEMAFWNVTQPNRDGPVLTLVALFQAGVRRRSGVTCVEASDRAG